MINSSMPVFLGLLELVVFFVFDYMYARTLNTYKRNFPELDECAPAESPDLDTVAVLDSLATTAVEFYQSNRERMSGEPGSGSGAYTSVDPDSHGAAADSGHGASRSNPLHAVVVVCGTVAPIATLLLLLFTKLFGWTAFPVPNLLSYVVVCCGAVTVLLYGSRAINVSSYADVTKTQWIAMTWLRLNAMFAMGLVALLGVGAWFVAGCMFAVAFYLAHRVLKMEKHLSCIQRDTQLVRDEVDTSRVFVPGSAESRKAMGIHEGYSALSS